MSALRRWRIDWAAIGLVAVLLAAVQLLPPDTSLDAVRRAGALRVCVPLQRPPLVTGLAERPGLDIELLREVAASLGVSLDVVTRPRLGRDFNLRDSGVTRAQCDLIAGGVVASPMTRAFLDVTQPYAETGWAAVSVAAPVLEGRRVGVLAGGSGLDRLALSKRLREAGSSVAIIASADDLAAGLRDGRFDVGITEGLAARELARKVGGTVSFLPGLDRDALVFGLWKGDLTLKRAIRERLAQMERTGITAGIVARYAAPVAPG
jgi:polar amino acid transport system substrate-binding protein/cystine transport system substrate-binding protein/membrane-bound lytic murein transglycosylase F